MICDECETVAHCLKNGCVPKQPALKPLTDEEFSKLCLRVAPRLHRTIDAIKLLHGIEAAHGITEKGHP